MTYEDYIGGLWIVGKDYEESNKACGIIQWIEINRKSGEKYDEKMYDFVKYALANKEKTEQDYEKMAPIKPRNPGEAEY